MTPDNALPCGHSATCLRDGACGWCAEVARLRAFCDEWYAAAQDYERRLGCSTRSPWASDEPTPLEAERDALRAHVGRLAALEAAARNVLTLYLDMRYTPVAVEALRTALGDP